MQHETVGGLRPEYTTYARQRCFIGHTQEAEWCEDLLSACDSVLPDFGLEPWYAEDHFDPTKPLRGKVAQAIANARYGIYDLSCWNDKHGVCHQPRNVYIELGMAIALNRPTLLLRHSSNAALPLSACLQGGELLTFTGDHTLKAELMRCLPQWIDTPPDQDWHSRFCIFGNRACQFREAHPRARRWGSIALSCHVADGLDQNHRAFQFAERAEIRAAFDDIFDRYSDLTFDYLDELPLADGYQFILCSHCQAARSVPFAIYRITPQTPAHVFITIGMSIALETIYDYDIPKVLMVRKEEDLPSLLRGYEVVEAASSSEAKKKLRAFVPAVIQKVREVRWKPRLLPFVISAMHPASEINSDTKAADEDAPVAIETASVRADAVPALYIDGRGEVWLGVQRLNQALPKLMHRCLDYLWSRRGTVVSYEDFASELYGTSLNERYDPKSSIEKLIRRLRQTLEPGNPSSRTYVDVQPRVGYVLRNYREEDEALVVEALGPTEHRDAGHSREVKNEHTMAKVPGAIGRDAFLQGRGFRANPFATTNAEQEVEFLPMSFVQDSLFNRLLGDTTRPESLILFAPHGYGKTSYRIEVGRLARERRDAPALVITINDLLPLLERSGANGLSIDGYISLLRRLTLEAIDSELQFSTTRSALFSADQQRLDHFHALLSLYVPRRVFGKTISEGARDLAKALELEQLGPKEWLRELSTLAHRAGFGSVYAMIDGIDELRETHGNPSLMLQLVAPLLDAPDLLHECGFAFKFFLPLELKSQIQQSLVGRPDRIPVFELKWTEEMLLEMLSRRLEACSSDLNTSTGLVGLARRFQDLCDADFDVDRRLVRAAQGSPRRLFDLSHTIVSEHCNSTADLQAPISASTITAVLQTT